MLFRRHSLTSSFLLSTLMLAAASAPSAQVVTVPAALETPPVPSGGDAADDAAVWVHPTHPLLSLMVCTDKQSGLAVYNMDGLQRQYIPGGRLNNVDLRYGFRFAGTQAALVCSGERNQNVLAIYAVDTSTRLLGYVAARPIPFGMDVYGCCMYRSRLTGDTYFIATSEDGEVEQYRLFDNGAGKVDAVLVRSFDVGSTAEGCVADDQTGFLFIAEEEHGIWRYGAEPGAGSTRVLVDDVSGGHLEEDVEGLSLYYAANGAGYLIASSQGNDRFVVYDRAAPHAHRLTFTVGANSTLGIDAVTGTDGQEVINLRLGNRWPAGALVVQDDSNPGGNQNFKVVDWRDIAAAANPPLIVDSNHDALGARGLTASRTYRNGTNVNPSTLTSATAPALDTPFAVDLDCSAHGPGVAIFELYLRPHAGILSPAGEILVDRTSQRLIRLSRAHGSGSVRFHLPIPPDVALLGIPSSAQGKCLGVPGARLSNAIDMLLGW